MAYLNVALGAEGTRLKQGSLVGHTPTIDVQTSLHVVQSVHHDVQRCRHANELGNAMPANSRNAERKGSRRRSEYS